MNKLSQEQLTAAHSAAKTTLCTAAAGSGKTSVMVERVRWMICDQEVKPSSICVVTFTSAAAKELGERLEAVLGTSVQLGHCGTLHALLLKLLRRYEVGGFGDKVTVLPEEEADAVLLALAASLKVKGSLVSLKAMVKDCLANRPTPGNAGVVAKEFVRCMKSTGELSYDALLGFGLLLVQTGSCQQFDHLLVDEFQDSAREDWAVYRAMSPETEFFVGDPSQSIYGFRGGRFDAFGAAGLDPASVKLPISVNYRSAQEVVQAGARLAEPGSVTGANYGAPVGSVSLCGYLSAEEEVGAVVSGFCCLPPNQTAAVLLRTNRAADRFRQALQQYLPAQAANQLMSKAGEKEGLAVLRAMASPTNANVRRMLMCFGAGVADVVAAKANLEVTSLAAAAKLSTGLLVSCIFSEAEEFGQLLGKFFERSEAHPSRAAQFWLRDLQTSVPYPATLQDLLLAAQEAGRQEPQPTGRLHVGTVHSAKGLEWDHVFLPSFEEHTWPGAKQGDELEEERRVAYVAVTRARMTCTMSWCQQRKDDFKQWKVVTCNPSRFALATFNSAMKGSK